ncbi:TPA: hypothetical protein N5O15_004277 [Enterobacter hormaechei subsp. xiangfangensis]|nr:hypothetical protein [Enterobacter hormaechei subsp. xiangfangensis]
MRVKFDVGEKVGMLTLIESFPKDEKGVYKGKFSCACGSTKIIRLSFVKSGHTKSCGCLKIEAKRTHGMSSSSEYRIMGGKIVAASFSDALDESEVNDAEGLEWSDEMKLQP